MHSTQVLFLLGFAFVGQASARFTVSGNCFHDMDRVVAAFNAYKYTVDEVRTVNHIKSRRLRGATPDDNDSNSVGDKEVVQKVKEIGAHLLPKTQPRKLGRECPWGTYVQCLMEESVYLCSVRCDRRRQRKLNLFQTESEVGTIDHEVESSSYSLGEDIPLTRADEYALLTQINSHTAYWCRAWSDVNFL